jgi:hypothetical protein
MNSEDPGVLQKKDDSTLAITVLVIFLTSLAIGGYYLWKYKHYFGFEDKRFKNIPAFYPH